LLPPAPSSRLHILFKLDTVLFQLVALQRVKMASPASTLGSNFSRILKAFKDTLSQDDLDDFKLSTLDDLELVVLAIQEKQASERKMKNLTRLKCFLEAMEQYDEVVKVFLNASDILSFIWVRTVTRVDQ